MNLFIVIVNKSHERLKGGALSGFDDLESF